MLKILKLTSKNGNSYFQLVYDLGYRLIYLTYKTYDILEIANLTPQELNNHFLMGNTEYIIKGGN